MKWLCVCVAWATDFFFLRESDKHIDFADDDSQWSNSICILHKQAILKTAPVAYCFFKHRFYHEADLAGCLGLQLSSFLDS